jgi:hypothetical protein
MRKHKNREFTSLHRKWGQIKITKQEHSSVQSNPPAGKKKIVGDMMLKISVAGRS